MIILIAKSNYNIINNNGNNNNSHRKLIDTRLINKLYKQLDSKIMKICILEMQLISSYNINNLHKIVILLDLPVDKTLTRVKKVNN